MIRSTIAHGLALFALCGCTGEFPTDKEQLQAAEKAYDSQLLIRSLDEIEASHVAPFQQAGLRHLVQPFGQQHRCVGGARALDRDARR